MIEKIKYILLKIYSKFLPTKKSAYILGVKVGDNSNFGKNHNFGSEPYLITIGDNFNSASNINFITHDGSIRVLRNLYPQYAKSDLIKEIIIGNNVFIGMNVNILPGTIIENNVIIGAGSIVKGNILANSVYAGIPAKYICSINDYMEKNKDSFIETKHLNYFEKKEFLEKIKEKEKKKKIFLLIHQLNTGGSQKVVMNLAKYLNKDKYDVNLIVINKIGEYANFSHPSVKVIDLKSKNIRSSLFKIYALLKKEKPDIVFSALSYLSLLFSIFMPLIKSKNMKFIARETNTLSISNESLNFTKLRNYFYKKFYKKFDLIICQAKYMQDDLVNNFNIDINKTKVIYNPVDVKLIEEKMIESGGNKLDNTNDINLLAVGRLHKNKGFDLLIEAFSKLPFNFKLQILGEGSEKEELITIAEKFNCNNRICFLGFKSNPYTYMKNADLLVLSSRHEGLPNVVLESNICKLPVIAFDCPGGTSEIIINGENGFLVECKNILKLKDTIEMASKYTWNKERIYESTKNKFNSETIIMQYQEILI